ncbi:MAG: hypothetical protein HDS23_06245 [Bacteroides sp.]|nr:hypothetical protein [Bacteroides sp.]
MIDPKKNNSFEFVKDSLPIGKNYRMFDPLSMDGIRIWDDILENAKEIYLWDPFFHSLMDHEFFQSVKTQGVRIEILTLNPSDQKYTYNELKRKAKELRTNIIKTLESNQISLYSVTIRGIDQINFNGKKYGFSTWHDRYLLTDQGVYLMGTSMNGQLDGSKLYGIHKLEYQEDEVLVKCYYKKYQLQSQNRPYGFFINK